MDEPNQEEAQITEGEVAAWHEGGHVVVGLYHDFVLGYVGLLQEGKPCPRTHWATVEGEEFPLSTYDIEAVTFMALGGAVAEMLAFDVPFEHPGVQAGYERDFEEIVRQLYRRGEPSEAPDVIKRLDWSLPRVRLIFERDERFIQALRAVAERIFLGIERTEESVSGQELSDLVWSHFPEQNTAD